MFSSITSKTRRALLESATARAEVPVWIVIANRADHLISPCREGLVLCGI